MSDEPEPPGRDPSLLRQRRRSRRRLVTLLVLMLLLALLGVDNGHDVPLEYLVGEAQVRLVWVIIVAFATGAIAARMYDFVRGRRDDD